MRNEHPAIGSDPVLVARVSTWSRAALLALGCYVLACGRGAADGSAHRASRERPPDLVLVTLDTTRPDRLGAYGGPPGLTPNLDRVAREGIVFADATSAAPLTLPAHASLMTGLAVTRHGVRLNGVYSLEERFDTLAERLSAHGYRTAAFVATVILDPEHGIAQGFGTYRGVEPAPTTGAARRRERPAVEVVAEARRWLEQARTATEPVFVWVHLYDAHAPYAPPAVFAERFAHLGAYEAEIAAVDDALGALFADLRQRGRDTVLAVAADHGESLGEHRERYHGFFVYDSTVRVPLLLWAPHRLEAGVVEEPVALQDLFATFLELAGAPGNVPAESRSLLPLLDESSSPGESREAREIVVASETPAAQYSVAPLLALRSGRWKLIEAPRPELYDLDRDPGERSDLSRSEPAATARLRTRLSELTTAAYTASPRPVDAELEAMLESLGYLASPPAGGRSSERDPKDVAPYLDRVGAGKERLARGDARAAYAIFDEVVRAFPAARTPLELRARSAVRARDLDLAEKAYRELAAAFPDDAAAHYNLALALLGRGRHGEARRHLERSLELEPEATQTRYALAVSLVALGEPRLAREQLVRYLELAPEGEDAAEAKRLLAHLESTDA